MSYQDELTLGQPCRRIRLEQIQTRAIYSVREVAQMACMTQARVRRLAQRSGVPFVRQAGADYLRRTDIADKIPALHERACHCRG